MVFSSTNGVTTFYPDRISSSPYVPPVVLTDFHLFNKPVTARARLAARQPIWVTDSLTLTHTQSIFTLQFAGLSYAAPEKNRYRYRLERSGNRMERGRQHAPPSHLYRAFRPDAMSSAFRHRTKDGVWNEKGVTLGPHGATALVEDMVVQEPDGSGVCGLDVSAATKCGSGG